MVQWGEVQTAVGKLYQSVTIALDQFFQQVLKKLPLDPITTPVGQNDYFADPVQLPQILKDGRFADQVAVGSINADVLGAVVSPAINSLWIQDKVMIFKITDHAFNQVATGQACKFWPKQTVCRDNVAHIFARWVADDTPSRPVLPASLNRATFYPWGASDKGTAADGTPNADHLAEYALTLDTILDSATATQAAHGYLYSGTTDDTLKQLTQHPTDIDQADLASWTIPICDIDAVLKAKGNGKTYLGVGPTDQEDGKSLINRGICTCLQAQGWPKDTYGDFDRPHPSCEFAWH